MVGLLILFFSRMDSWGLVMTFSPGKKFPGALLKHMIFSISGPFAKIIQCILLLLLNGLFHTGLYIGSKSVKKASDWTLKSPIHLFHFLHFLASVEWAPWTRWLNWNLFGFSNQIFNIFITQLFESSFIHLIPTIDKKETTLRR